MRNGKGQHTIFRDKGGAVCKFRIKRGYANPFKKYNFKFYLEWQNKLKKGKKESYLAELNLEEGKITFLLWIRIIVRITF